MYYGRGYPRNYLISQYIGHLSHLALRVAIHPGDALTVVLCVGDLELELCKAVAGNEVVECGACEGGDASSEFLARLQDERLAEHFRMLLSHACTWAHAGGLQDLFSRGDERPQSRVACAET